MKAKPVNRSQRVLGLAILGLVLSFFFSYLSYLYENISFGLNPYSALSSILFWISIVVLLVEFPLRQVSKLFERYVKSSRGLVIFILYMSLHLLVYGFILETIVTTMYPALVGFNVQPALSISATPLFPFSIQSVLGNFFLSPSIVIDVPPFLSASLSLYSIAMAVIIGILVETNIMKALEMKRSCSLGKRSTALVAVPLIGVIGGASCCLSLPIFISLIALPVSALASPSVVLGYYIAYFLFPPATAFALKLNMDSINKISNKILSQQNRNVTTTVARPPKTQL